MSNLAAADEPHLIWKKRDDCQSLAVQGDELNFIALAIVGQDDGAEITGLEAVFG